MLFFIVNLRLLFSICQSLFYVGISGHWVGLLLDYHTLDMNCFALSVSLKLCFLNEIVFLNQTLFILLLTLDLVILQQNQHSTIPRLFYSI